MSRKSLSDSVKYVVDTFGVRHLLVRGLEYSLIRTPIFRSVYWKLVPKLYRRKYKDDFCKYSFPPNPFKLVWVSPDEIVRFTPRGRLSDGIKWDVGKVKEGSWDQDSIERGYGSVEVIENTPIYQALKNHLIHDVPWEKTEFFQIVAKKVTSGESCWHSCSTLDDIRDRCKYLNELAQTIDSEGYKTQAELRDNSPRIGDARGFGYFNEQMNEICVDVARDGELLLVDNRHRLMIAQILDIETVPVMVLTRHAEWMSYREKVGREAINDLHPDLLDLPHQSKQKY